MFGNRVFGGVIGYEKVILEWDGPCSNITGVFRGRLCKNPGRRPREDGVGWPQVKASESKDHCQLLAGRRKARNVLILRAS